ncbi:MAG: hypothetical protein ACKO0V_16080 [bacterium]
MPELGQEAEARHPMMALRKTLLITLFALISVMSADEKLSAQQTNSVGLPVIKENYGLENPPDLPDLPSAGSVQVNSAPAANGVSTNPATSGSGVLSTLDNLPPVGSTGNNSGGRTYTPQLPEPVRNQQNAGRGSQPVASQGANQPRVVRFGDVRNESEARRQYPELAQNDRQAPRLPEPKPPTGLAKYNPLRLLNRFNPMRLDKPEPPLVQKSAGPGDELVDEGALAAAGNRAGVSDRTDIEIQKRVDRIIREEFGNKTSDFSVEVINREVFIKARPTWFWQKRQLSEDLQRLPGIDSKRLHITVY